MPRRESKSLCPSGHPSGSSSRADAGDVRWGPPNPRGAAVRASCAPMSAPRRAIRATEARRHATDPRDFGSVARRWRARVRHQPRRRLRRRCVSAQRGRAGAATTRPVGDRGRCRRFRRAARAFGHRLPSEPVALSGVRPDGVLGQGVRAVGRRQTSSATPAPEVGGTASSARGRRRHASRTIRQ